MAPIKKTIYSLDKSMEFREWLVKEDSEMTSRESADGFEFSYNLPGVQGSIYAKKDQENPDLYRVTRVWVKPEGKGYGKKLYLAALAAVTKKGAMLAPAKNSTSDSAANLWRSLHADPKVLKTPLGPKDWPETGRNNTLLSKYPKLRFSDPKTYPPKDDAEFWTFSSGYKLGSGTSMTAAAPPNIQRRQWPTLTKTSPPAGTENLELEDL